MTPRGTLRRAGLVLAAAAAVGCTKTGDSVGTVDPAATAELLASASAAPSAERSPRDAAAHPRGGAASGSPAASSPPRRGAAAPSSSAPPAPAHPLADWMRATATTAYESKNLDAIAAAFEKMEAWAPPGYPNWASIAADGAEAAQAGHMEAVKAACRGCHTQYEARYKGELSTRPL